MHTTTLGDQPSGAVIATHNGDYSGDVTLRVLTRPHIMGVRDTRGVIVEELTLPFWMVKELVGQYLKYQCEVNLEKQSGLSMIRLLEPRGMD